MKTAGNIQLSALALCVGLTVSQWSARADQQFTLQFGLPMQVQTQVSETGCANSPGPTITVQGQIMLGTFEAQLIFQNNVQGTHQTVVTYETNLVLNLGAPVSIPKQPVLGGVGGNPYIWIQFIDGGGNALSDELFLGRCVQGLTLNNSFINQVVASVAVSADGCLNHPGPTITFGGSLSLAGLKARLIFRNNMRGTHAAESVSEVTLVVSGTPVQIPKQPVLGGSGGNPLIWLQFLEQGAPIGDPIFLGRCNQM